MAKSPRSLSEIEAWDPESGDLQVVIETPKDSRNKFAYDPGIGAFRLRGILPEGSVFPFDFGFVPSTLGEDGDPLDVLVLLDAGVGRGVVLTVRLLGVIEAEQTEDDKTVRNDRLIAVAVHAHTHEHEHHLKDLRPGLIDEIVQFFVQYNRLRGKEFKPLGNRGPKAAIKLVEDAAARFQKR